MIAIDRYLQRKLAERVQQHSLRVLQPENQLVDFCSNDYLGFSQSTYIKEKLSRLKPAQHIGATGSRLLTGNNNLVELLEKDLAIFHKAEAGLIFPSGYMANIGLIASVPSREDTIIYDRLIHASIRDAVQLAKCKSYNFKHNDLADLEKKISHAAGNVFVVIESIYSMDGDAAPLEAIVELCEQKGAALIVDEAHSTGVYGEKGEGYCVEKGVEDKVWARIHTFGKAIGGHGAIIVGNDTLRQFLVNFSRTFIYTTGLPFHSLQMIQLAYQQLEKGQELAHLKANIQLFLEQLSPEVRQHFIPSTSPIHCLVYPGNDEVKKLAQHIQANGFDVRPILHPTVPKGTERLRISIHACNTPTEISKLTNILNTWAKESL